MLFSFPMRLIQSLFQAGSGLSKEASNWCPFLLQLAPISLTDIPRAEKARHIPLGRITAPFAFPRSNAKTSSRLEKPIFSSQLHKPHSKT